MIKTIIIEDEKPAARRLQRMLTNCGVEILAMLHSVQEAINWFQENDHPDLIFLDIQLSDGLSFDIFENVKTESAIIFTTAYDEYALRAFKLNSVDYLLKPIDDEELEAALDKYKNSTKSSTINVKELRTLLNFPGSAKTYKSRFTAQVGQHLKLVDTSNIECFYSESKSTFMHTDTARNYLVDYSLENVEDEIDPQTFFRINRKAIININSIKDIITYTNSRLEIKLQNFEEFQLIVSRERVKEFKEWLNSN